jgi:hypothetical protein
MWFDDIPEGNSWARLWHGYIRCGDCSGIRKVDGDCPVCKSPAYVPRRHVVQLQGGTEVEVMDAFMGADARYEDWVYLMMLEREWKRPLVDADRYPNIAESSRPAPRAVIVLVFWSYFETRIERLFREGIRDIGETIQEDLLRRYASVGARLDRLYRIVFGTTYWSDLNDLGFERVATLLQDVQQRRNEFTHGQPAAINEGLINNLVETLKEEHEAWIAVFNKRATHPTSPTLCTT